MQTQYETIELVVKVCEILFQKFYLFFSLYFAATAHSSSQLVFGDWDIDDGGRADALTDGLFFYLCLLVMAKSLQPLRIVSLYKKTKNFIFSI